ncbi:MAG: FlgO family outer membrane protein [Chitinispirillaceae bacterium]
MRNPCLLLVLMLIMQVRAGEAPEWVKGFGRGGRFAARRYITGYGMADIGKNDQVARSMQLARENAVAMLVSSIRSTFTVRSRMESRYTRNSGQKDKILEKVTNSVLSEGTLQLENMGTEYYRDESAEKVHALVWIDRVRYVSSLESRMSKSASILRNLRGAIQDSMEEGSFSSARKLFPLVREKFGVFRDDCYAWELFGKSEMGDEFISLLTFVEQLPVLLRRRPSASCDALASFVVSDLLSQFSLSGKRRIAVFAPLSFGGEISSFSLVLGEVLERELARTGGVSPVSRSDYAARAVMVENAFEIARTQGAQYLLTTTYSRAGEEVYVSLKVHDVAQEQVLASSFDYIDSDVVSRSGDISVPELRPVFEVWAGNGRLVIQKGHSYRFFVRTAGPLFLRVLARLENGMVLVPDPLFKNYYLETHKSPQALPGLFTIDSSLSCSSLEFRVSVRPFGELDLRPVVIGGRVYSAVSGRMGRGDGEVLFRSIEVVEGGESR